LLQAEERKEGPERQMEASAESFRVVVPKDHLKSLSSIIGLISKVGKDLLLEVENGHVRFRALNDAKSAFAAVEFDDEFFELFEAASDLLFLCRISVRSVSAAFKNIRNASSLSIYAQAVGADNELVFELNLAHGISRTHRLNYADATDFEAAFNEEEASVMRSEARTFNQLLLHIHQAQEISMEVGPETFKMRSRHQDRAPAAVSADYLHKHGMTTGALSMSLYTFVSKAIPASTIKFHSFHVVGSA
jgi:Rad9